MRQVLLAVLAVFAFALSACEQQSTPIAPADGQAPVVFDSQSDFSGGLDSDILADDPGDRKLDPRVSIGDAEAMAWIRLLLAANPEMDDATKAALKEAITASNKRRAEIMRDSTLTPEQKKAALAEEHLALMRRINGSDLEPGIVTREQIEKANALKEKIETDRKERMDKMIEARIDQQIKAWTIAMKLTPDQQAAIKAELMKQQKLIAEARIEFGKDAAGFSKKMQEIQKATDAAIRALLLPEQQVIWDKMHGRVVKTDTSIEARVDQQIKAWTPMLKLTTEQQAAIRTELLNKEKLMAQARTELGKDPAALSKKLQEIQKASDAAIRALLTPEQQLIWDKMHGGGKTGGVIGTRG